MKEKKSLVVDDYMLDKVFDKIKEIIVIEKISDKKILIDIDDKMPNYIISKTVVILMALTCYKRCIIKDDGQFYPQISLEESTLVKSCHHIESSQLICRASI